MKLLCLGLLACFFTHTFAHNENTPQAYQLMRPSTDPKLYFLIAPYAYIFGMNGTQTIQGQTSKIDTTPADVLKNLDKIDAIFQLHTELVKGPWNLFVDPTYIKVTMPLSQGPIRGSFSNTIAIFDYGVFRTLFEDFTTSRPYKVQAMIAGRYFGIKGDINLNKIVSTGKAQRFNTPMIGARWTKYLSDRTSLDIRGDYGGFHLDNVDKTYDLYAFIFYAMTIGTLRGGGAKWA